MKSLFATKSSLLSASWRSVRYVRSKVIKPPIKKSEKTVELISDAESVPTTPSWQWVKPEKKVKKSEDEILQEMFFGKAAVSPTRLDEDVIPVVPGVYLTPDEIIEALKRLGCLDINVISVKGKLDTLDNFIFGTGSSTRHIKKMSDVLVRALRSRGLKKAPGFKRAEGERDDDWVIVDCYNHAVHLMMPDTRRALNLEHHWSMESRPSAPFNLKENGPDEQTLERLLQEYPIPSDYNPGGDADPTLGYIDLDKKPPSQSSAPPRISSAPTTASRKEKSREVPRKGREQNGRSNKF